MSFFLLKIYCCFCFLLSNSKNKIFFVVAYIHQKKKDSTLFFSMMDPSERTALFNRAADIYAAFVAKVRPIVGESEQSNPQFGTQTLKPSQLLDMHKMKALGGLAGQVEDAMRSPVYDVIGELIALQYDSDGNVITEAQYEAWLKTKFTDAWKTDHEELIELCNRTNAELKSLATAHGVSVTDVYNEINRRGARNHLRR